jgi:type IV pilus assembly protein PilP
MSSRHTLSKVAATLALSVFASSSFAQDPAALAAPAAQPQSAQAPAADATQAQSGSAQTASGSSPSSQEGIFSGFMDPFDYDPRGRRDPFVQPVPDRPVEQGNVAGPLLPLQKFELGQLRLVGIIWDVKRPKAMIKDPTGQTHVVGPNTKVGPRNGYIAVIREGEMVIVETQDQDGRLVSSAQVVKIAK